jgi:hypothetical protein
VDESPAAGHAITIGTVAIQGAPPGLHAGRLADAVRAAIARGVGSADLSHADGAPIDIPSLTLRLPPNASEASIAEALARATARVLEEGGRP